MTMPANRGPRGTDWEPLARELLKLTRGHQEELRAQLAAAHPAFHDQLLAAIADAKRKEAQATAFMRQHSGLLSGYASFSQVPAQLDARLCGLYIRVITELAAGTRAACPHIRMDAPVPFIAMVFSGRADCWPCTRRRGPVRPVLTGREEHTCDVCGAYRPGQAMHQLTRRFGPATIAAGACDGCIAPLAAVKRSAQ